MNISDFLKIYKILINWFQTLHIAKWLLLNKLGWQPLFFAKKVEIFFLFFVYDFKNRPYNK